MSKISKHDRQEILSLYEFKRMVIYAKQMRETDPKWNPWKGSTNV